MKNLLTAVLLLCSFGASAGIQSDIETSVQATMHDYMASQIPTRIEQVKVEIVEAEELVKTTHDRALTLQKALYPVQLEFTVTQYVEGDLFVAVHRGETFIVTSNRIQSTGRFRLYMRKLPNITMLDGKTPREYSNFQDIGTDDVSAYVEERKSTTGFYEAHAEWVSATSALEESKALLVKLQEYK